MSETIKAANAKWMTKLRQRTETIRQDAEKAVGAGAGADAEKLNQARRQAAVDAEERAEIRRVAESERQMNHQKKDADAEQSISPEDLKWRFTHSKDIWAETAENAAAKRKTEAEQDAQQKAQRKAEAKTKAEAKRKINQDRMDAEWLKAKAEAEVEAEAKALEVKRLAAVKERAAEAQRAVLAALIAEAARKAAEIKMLAEALKQQAIMDASRADWEIAMQMVSTACLEDHHGQILTAVNVDIVEKLFVKLPKMRREWLSLLGVSTNTSLSSLEPEAYLKRVMLKVHPDKHHAKNNAGWDRMAKLVRITAEAELW